MRERGKEGKKCVATDECKQPGKLILEIKTGSGRADSITIACSTITCTVFVCVFCTRESGLGRFLLRSACCPVFVRFTSERDTYAWYTYLTVKSSYASFLLFASAVLNACCGFVG